MMKRTRRSLTVRPNNTRDHSGHKRRRNSRLPMQLLKWPFREFPHNLKVPELQKVDHIDEIEGTVKQLEKAIDGIIDSRKLKTSAARQFGNLVERANSRQYCLT